MHRRALLLGQLLHRPHHGLCPSDHRLLFVRLRLRPRPRRVLGGSCSPPHRHPQRSQAGLHRLDGSYRPIDLCRHRARRHGASAGPSARARARQARSGPALPAFGGAPRRSCRARAPTCSPSDCVRSFSLAVSKESFESTAISVTAIWSSTSFLCFGFLALRGAMAAAAPTRPPSQRPPRTARPRACARPPGPRARKRERGPVPSAPRTLAARSLSPVPSAALRRPRGVPRRRAPALPPARPHARIPPRAACAEAARARAEAPGAARGSAVAFRPRQFRCFRRRRARPRRLRRARARPAHPRPSHEPRCHARARGARRAPTPTPRSGKARARSRALPRFQRFESARARAPRPEARVCRNRCSMRMRHHHI